MNKNMEGVLKDSQELRGGGEKIKGPFHSLEEGSRGPRAGWGPTWVKLAPLDTSAYERKGAGYGPGFGRLREL